MTADSNCGPHERSDGPQASIGVLADGRWRILAFCWFGWVFDLYDLILFSFLKRPIAGELQLELYGEIAWIEGWSLLASAVGGLVFGRLADKTNLRLAMVTSILLYSLGALLTGFASNEASLLFARCLTGLGVGGEWGMGHAVVAMVWSGKQRDRVHGLLQAGSPVAMALPAGVACFASPFLGCRMVFFLSVLPAILALVARAELPSNIFNKQPQTAARTAALPISTLFSPAYRRVSLLLFSILVLHMANFWAVYAELPAALMQMHHASLSDVGWFQITINSVHVLADIGFGFLAGRFGQRRMFVASCLIFALGQLLVLVQLETAIASFFHFTLAVAAMGLGAGTWSSFGALFGRYYPASLRATAASLFYAGARAVQLPLKPAVAAAFASTQSFAPALWIGVVCALGSALLMLLLPALANHRDELAS